MKDKLKYVWYLMKARDYIIVTNDMGASYLPSIDPYDLESILLVQAQRGTLAEVRAKLDEVIKAHDVRIKQLVTQGKAPRSRK